MQDIKISVFGACPGAQLPGLGRAPPRLPYLDRGGGKFSRLAFLQELRISQFLGGGACSGAQPLGLGRAPHRLYPILTVRGGGKISHLAFFQDIKISQFLELARVPSPRAQAGPTAFTLSHRGGGIFPSSVFAGIEDFKVFGWRSLPGGTAPGPMQGPPPPLPYFDCWGGAKFPV